MNELFRKLAAFSNALKKEGNLSKKLTLTVLLSVFCAISMYLLLKPKPRSQADVALAYLTEGKFSMAEEAIRSLPATSSFPQGVYKGYMELVRGNFLESSLFFSAMISQSPGQLKEAARLEILLAQAANCYFEGRDQEFSSHVERARIAAPYNSYVIFFEGLSRYIRGEYPEALKAWQACDPAFPFLQGTTGWMGPILEKEFPQAWKQLHVAHCLIEEGDLLLGREILEKENRLLENQEMGSLATLLLGISYLKEAEHIPLEQRGSYYKLARFYFERSGTKDQFQRERQLITCRLQKAAERLILSDLDEEKQKWGFDFVHTLMEWKADPVIDSLAEQLAQKILSRREENDVKLCFSIRQEFLGSPFHVLLTQKLIEAMAQRIKQGETEELCEIWAKVETLSPNPTPFAKKIALLASEEIFAAIKRDNKNLTHTRRYLTFWQGLGRSAQEKDRLAQDLLLHAKFLWQQENQEKKGERLMELALKLCESKGAFEREISRFLTDLYSQAENSNMIGRLMMIFDTMDRFHINKQALATPGKLANHLADAEYLYQVQNYILAKAHAMWVLKLDPDNERAQRLVGLSSFHLGEYSRALCYLKKLSQPDQDARRALMLSQVFSSQEQDKHLAQIDNFDAKDE